MSSVWSAWLLLVCVVCVVDVVVAGVCRLYADDAALQGAINSDCVPPAGCTVLANLLLAITAMQGAHYNIQLTIHSHITMDPRRSGGSHCRI